MNREWETVIGLEVHVELATKSKIFCSCSTEYTQAPNTHCCPVCMGLPGTLPVLNEQVLDYAVMAGLVLNCEIEKTQGLIGKTISTQICQKRIKYLNCTGLSLMTDMLR